MNKKMREILASIEEKEKDFESKFNDGDYEKAGEVSNEIDELKKAYALAEKHFKAEKAGVDDEAIEKAKAGKVDAIKAFANAARNGFKAMNEGTPAAGGYTVPEDISTKIEELRVAKASLLDVVTREAVTTLSGARTYKKRAQQTGFSKVAEGGKITAKDTPQFDRYTYMVEKYAGFFPVTNELLADSDANVANVLMKWIADEDRITANKLILETLNGAAGVQKDTVAGLDDIKRILNIVLGQAFKPTSRIITNDNGLQWLDTLKDEQGYYLLQASPTNPMQMVLTAGSTTVPVTVLPTVDFPNVDDKAPFFIGDFKEACVFFDRKHIEIKQSDIAAIGDINAYEQDLTVYRAIERFDCVVRDTAAYVIATLDNAVQG